GLSGWPLGARLPALSSLVPRGLGLDRWASQQEQALRAADLRFRQAAGGQSRALGEALRRLRSIGSGQEGGGHVIGAAALAEAGLHPDSKFQPPATGPDAEDGPVLDSLTPLNLVCVPGKVAPVVTTRRQWLAWRQTFSGDSEGEAPPSVRRAL